MVAAVTYVALAMVGLITYEAVRFAEGRDRVRHQVGVEPPS